MQNTFDISLIANIVAALGAIFAVIVALYVYWDSSSPDVQVYLDVNTDKGTSSLVVKNFGSKPAYNIKINEFDFGLVQPALLDRVKNSFISQGIPMLAPGQNRNTILASNQYAATHYSEACIRGTVTYAKKSFFRKRRMSSSYVIDYFSFANSTYTTSDFHQLKVYVKLINESLDRIAKQLGTDE